MSESTANAQNVHAGAPAARDQLSPRQVAQALGVSESSVKRWCDRGLLGMDRTVGGHRRLSVAAVVEFMRKGGYLPAQPELLGLPVGVGRHAVTVEAAVQPLLGALESGDEALVRQLLIGLYLSGTGIAELGDRVIAPGFAALGERWQQGALEIYRERRAVEVMSRTLFELRRLLPEPGARAPAACGASLVGDPYTLANTLVELVLRELGWRSQSLGSQNPPSTLVAALRDNRPQLFWLSVSSPLDPNETRDSLATLYATAQDVGAALVVGGRGLDDRRRTAATYTAFCDTLQHLVGLVKALAPRTA